MKFNLLSTPLAAMLCALLLFSCTTDIEPPPPLSSSGVSSSAVFRASSSSGVSSSTVLRECEAIFNPANKFCYDGSVYDKCGGKEYTNPAGKFCYNGSVYDKCGGQVYTNPANKFCYDGTAYDKCNDQTYDPVYEACCDGQTYDNDAYVYYLADKVCYDGRLYDKCGSESFISFGEFCYDGTAYEQCDGMKYIPSSQICTNGVAIPAKCNGEGYNPLINGCCGGSTMYSKATQYCSNAKGAVVVNYDGSVTYEGKTYKTVVIGEQTWMAENLNYNAEGSKCNNNLESNCTTYGRLYDWATAKTICPSGWHLPSDAEWDALITAVGRGWKNGSNGTDAYGFAALSGGYGIPGGGFGDVGYGGFWWSATEYNAYDAYGRGMGDGNGNYFNKNILFSVRCVKD
jgi:uncharacterized protein (TIGR02145 family)